MTNEQAREYFKEYGFDYSIINEVRIRKLINMLEDKFIDKIENGHKFHKDMNLSMRKPLKKDIKVLKKGLKFAYLKCDGSYFHGREAISFNEDGFIGFCGWGDTSTSQQFLECFCEWCNWIHWHLIKEQEDNALSN